MKIRAEKRKGECTQINDVETNVFVHDEKVSQVPLYLLQSGVKNEERETKEKTID
jgi:hypothetical protein